MNNEQQMVVEFTRKFNASYSDSPIIPSQNICNLRMRLWEEEFLELKEAYVDKSLVKIADGLGDLLYVTYGAAIACGMNLRHHLFVPPIDNLFLLSETKFNERINKIESTLAILRKIFFLGNTNYELHKVYHLMFLHVTLELLQEVIYNTATDFNLDLRPIFLEIHRSNMTKLWEDGLPRIREDGKVIKPPTYSPPNLEPLIQWQLHRKIPCAS